MDTLRHRLLACSISTEYHHRHFRWGHQLSIFFHLQNFRTCPVEQRLLLLTYRNHRLKYVICQFQQVFLAYRLRQVIHCTQLDGAHHIGNRHILSRDNKRQLFSESEIGLNKAVALVTRINRFFGSTWVAEDRRYPVRKTGKEGKDHTANIVITCTDNIRSRLDLWRFLKSCRKDTPPDHATPFYWMDFGNAQFTGQVLIGTVRNRIAQPASKEFIAIPKMNVITEEVSYSMIRDTDSGPSCSLTEALHKQDLFINSMLAQAGCEILWKMIREGRTPYRGAYLNMETLRLVPIPV